MINTANKIILWIKHSVGMAMFALTFASALCGGVHAAEDLPLTSASALTGIAFDDRPLLLPVDRNFQMAMLTTSSELGRSCGRMESYGWRMNQSEQDRVNHIFNSTVDRLRALGYTVAPQALTSVAKDVTVFTADRSERHFMFLWSAGDLGLVMTLCETAHPVPMAKTSAAPSSVQVFPSAVDVVSSRLEANPHVAGASFTPLGKWEGSYICAQGSTGGTLDIDHVVGQDLTGAFRFYPTGKSVGVPAGSYTVSGQYDKATGRVLINPGKWIKRPPHYYNTVMVGKFDAANDTLSAFFQGVSGCTSFEARHVSNIHTASAVVAKHKKAVVKQKHAVKKSAVKSAKNIPAVASAPVEPVVPPSPVAAPVATAVAAPIVNVPVTSPAPVIPTPAAAVESPASTGLAIAPPAQAPTLPPEDKSPAGITLTAPAK